MRLLHVLSQRPGRTGSGVTLAALIGAAKAAGIEQSVVVGVPKREAEALSSGEMSLGLPPEHIFPLAFESDALPFCVPGMSDSMPYPSTVFGHMSPQDLERYRSTFRAHLSTVIERCAPDVIHAHHLWMVSALLSGVVDDLVATGALAKRPQRLLHSHATGLRQMLNHPALGNPLRPALADAAHVLALHPDHRDAIVSTLGVDDDRVSVVGAGFDPSIFWATKADVAAKNANDVVYAGKISAAKGVPQLLDAMEAHAKRRLPTRLIVCGGGTDAEAQTLIGRMQSLENVDYRGAVDQKTLAATLREASAFVLPSLYEGLPLVAAEALACGCRLAVTALPGVTAAFVPAFGSALSPIALPPREGIDQLSGPAAAAFAQAIDTTLVEVLSQGPVPEGTALAAPFTWEQVAAKVVPLWQRLGA